MAFPGTSFGCAPPSELYPPITTTVTTTPGAPVTPASSTEAKTIESIANAVINEVHHKMNPGQTVQTVHTTSMQPIANLTAEQAQEKEDAEAFAAGMRKGKELEKKKHEIATNFVPPPGYQLVPITANQTAPVTSVSPTVNIPPGYMLVPANQ